MIPGAITGELAAPFLRRWPVWPTVTGIVLGWGLALIPLGLPTPLWAGLAAFFAGAVIWGPWTSLSMAVFQDATPPAALAQVIAARSSLLIIAAPVGTALGGPLVAPWAPAAPCSPLPWARSRWACSPRLSWPHAATSSVRPNLLHRRDEDARASAGYGIRSASRGRRGARPSAVPSPA